RWSMLLMEAARQHLSGGHCASVPSPACGGGRGHIFAGAAIIKPPPQPSPACGEGSERPCQLDESSSAMACPTEPNVRSAHSVALCAGLHPVLDPVLRGLVGRRIHAFGGIADDVDDLRRVLLLVELVGAVGRLLDALMAVAERELDLAVRRLVLEV